MKKCTKCGIEKPLSDFYKQLGNIGGLRHDCKICHKNDDLKRARKRKYGITHSEFLALIQQQKNSCAICFQQLKGGIKTHLDHCHRTKKIRGVLCNNCNRGIGYLQDSNEILESALKYLKKYSVKTTGK